MQPSRVWESENETTTHQQPSWCSRNRAGIFLIACLFPQTQTLYSASNAGLGNVMHFCITFQPLWWSEGFFYQYYSLVVYLPWLGKQLRTGFGRMLLLLLLLRICLHISVICMICVCCQNASAYLPSPLVWAMCVKRRWRGFGCKLGANNLPPRACLWRANICFLPLMSARCKMVRCLNAVSCGFFSVSCCTHALEFTHKFDVCVCSKGRFIDLWKLKLKTLHLIGGRKGGKFIIRATCKLMQIAFNYVSGKPLFVSLRSMNDLGTLNWTMNYVSKWWVLFRSVCVSFLFHNVCIKKGDTNYRFFKVLS